MRCCAVTLHFTQAIKTRCSRIVWIEMSKCMTSFHRMYKIYCTVFCVEIQQNASVAQLMWKSIVGLERSTGLTCRKRRWSPRSSQSSNLRMTVAILTYNSLRKISKRPCPWRTCHLFIRASRTITSTSQWWPTRAIYSLVPAQALHQRLLNLRVISNIKGAN